MLHHSYVWPTTSGDPSGAGISVNPALFVGPVSELAVFIVTSVLNRDITFGNRTVLGSGIIQYYFQHISDKCHTVKK